METRSVEAVIRALEDAGVRYLVAGGLAVVAHGYLRLTKDIDLVVALNEDNARVFPLVSDAHRLTPVEIFLEEPFDFEHAYGTTLRQEVAPALAAAFVSLGDLIAMKRAAGREQDLADVAELERLHGRN